MLKVFVDSGSSIKQDEKEKYGVEIIPLRFSMGDKEYLDGIDLSIDEFYKLLIEDKLFPKTSLPSLIEVESQVNEMTANGDDVIILTISSQISGTFNALNTLFKDNDKVRVVDTKLAVGGIRLLVEEINRYRDESVDFIIKKINDLIPKVRILAIPENLDYLLRGGRLSKKEWLFGSMLNLKPIISIISGKVKVLAKKIGLKNSMNFIANALKEFKCDKNYPIIASYTKNKGNLEKLVDMTDEQYHKQMTVYDNLDPVIACHWGPNAFGYIFVGGETISE
ncbi:MAG: DegV family protein [Christensenellales bacterium]